MGIIRLLLAIAVFNSHFPFLEVPVVDGHEAVLAFFAISGFYIALILDTTYNSSREFYWGRFLSLYPMYLIGLSISVALLTVGDIHPMTGLDKMQSLLSDPLAFAIMLWTSACVFGQELLFSLGQSPDGGLHVVEASRHGIWRHAPLIQAWSLSLEIVFYALAPLLVRLKTPTLCGVVVLSLLAKIGVVTGPLADVVFFKRFFPTEFWLFGCGILAYRYYRTLPKQSRAIDYFCFILLVGAILIVGDVDDPYLPFALPAVTLVALPFVFRTFSVTRFDRDIGKISYPFYLLHFSAIAIFEEYWEEPLGLHILAATLIAAILAHTAINPGTEFLKQRLRAAKRLPLGAEAAPHPSLSSNNN